MTLRPAAAADVDAIVMMAQRFVAETPYRERIVGDQNLLRQFTLRLMTGPDSVIFVSEGSQEQPTGMIGVWIYPHPYSGERVASELVWWVEPEYRTGTAGPRLLRRAEAWALDQGATAMQMIAPNAHVGEFYARAGYVPVETMYQRSL